MAATRSLEERHARMLEDAPDALAQRQATLRDSAKPFASLHAAGSMAQLRFLDNLLGTPAGLGELLAIGAAGAETAAGAASARLRGEPMEVIGRFGRARREQREQFPASALFALQEHVPPVADVMAARDVVRGLPGALTRPVAENWKPGEPLLKGAFEDARAQGQALEAALREEHPVATGVGELGADFATLLTLRAPAARQIRNFTNPPRRVPKATSGPRAEFDKFASQPWVQQLDRGTRKSLEVGVEAAALSLISEGDPVTASFVAAGGQASGSLAMWLGSKYVKHLTPSLVATMFAVHLFRSATPGGERNIFEALDTSTNKALAAMGTGFFAAILGAGRLPKSTQENLGIIGEAIGPALRTPMLTMIRAFTDEGERGEDTTLRVMDRLAVDPDAFGDKARGAIEKTLESGGDLSDRIRRLMEDREFRRAYEDLESAAAPETSDAP